MKIFIVIRQVLDGDFENEAAFTTRLAAEQYRDNIFSEERDKHQIIGIQEIELENASSVRSSLELMEDNINSFVELFKETNDYLKSIAVSLKRS